jgi:peptidoglycan/LPS O-acetylase OafA/YrhL
MVTADLPLLGQVTGPRLLVDVRGLVDELVSGKAYFHLYFLLVLLQLAAVLPLVFLAMRRRAMGFASVLALAGILQIGAYILQSQVLRVSAPASMILWYIPSLLIGIWIGLDWNRWTEHWSRVRIPLMVGAGVGLSCYLTASFYVEVGNTVPSLAYNSAFTLYTIAVGLLLFGLGPAIANSRFGGPLSNLGQLSLPIFLIHPLVLYLIGGPRLTSVIYRLPIPVLWTTVFVLMVSYGIAWILVALWLDRPLFGQRLRLAPVGPA